MGCTIVFSSMGHGLYNTVVQRCMAHDPWVFVTDVSPMGHGKIVAEPCAQQTVLWLPQDLVIAQSGCGILRQGTASVS